MSRIQGLMLTLVLVGLLVYPACAPQAAPALAPPKVVAPAPAAPVPAAAAPAAPVRAAWEVEWEKVVAAAKQEGSLVLYSSFGAQQRQILIKPFTDKYGIGIEAMTGATGTFVPKLSMEQRAGIYSGDLTISGSTSYIPYKDLLDSLGSVFILPELTEPELIKKTWYFGELPWGDKAHTMLIGLMDFQQPILTNPNLVKAGEITSYADLLNPKWKGKISIQDPRIDGMGRMWFAVALELGDVDMNYMRELATKQELFITRDRRLQIEWVAKAKHAITIGAHSNTATEFIQLGAPVERLGLGTPFISGSTSGIGMWKNPPHPDATRLFINWLLSQEGQTFHSQSVGAQSQRLDVPTSHLESSKVLKPGLKLYRADNEEFAIRKSGDYYTKLAKEVFEPTK